MTEGREYEITGKFEGGRDREKNVWVGRSSGMKREAVNLIGNMWTTQNWKEWIPRFISFAYNE